MADRDPLAEVLALHSDPEGWMWSDADRLVYACECGDRMVMDDGVVVVLPGAVEMAAQWHTTHLANVVRAFLVSDETVERAMLGIHAIEAQSPDPSVEEYARAALAAATEVDR